MQNDPKFLNITFAHDSVRAYLNDYAAHLERALESVTPEALDAAAQELMRARLEEGRIFAAGNGGSAAITLHLGCDWQKGVHTSGHSTPHVNCLAANPALLTAIANDFGYEKSFAFQLEMANLKAKDLVVLISSSGNSENILQAAQYTKSKGAKVIGLTGFSGGKLKQFADISLHIPFDNYGLVEDCHQVLMHVLAQFHDLSFRKRL